jgi:cysteine desulfurase / selenocysteine lyase
LDSASAPDGAPALSGAPDQGLARFRGQFPVTERLLFLNHASEAPVSRPVRRRIDEYIDIAEGDPDAAPGDQTRLKRLLSHLLGGAPDEYAVMPNTATALNIVAGGLTWQPGDNVVVPAEEYPANTYPWLALRARGVEVRTVPLTGDLRVDPAEVARRVDGRTRVLAVSAVEYLSGFRNDLPALSRIAHANDALFVVDAIQAAGAVPLDVEADGIDVLAAGGYKWLLGPIGTGFAYFQRSTWSQIHPILPGARSSVLGSADAGAEFHLLDTAQRFETGCLPFALLHGWTAGLEMLLEAGVDRIHPHLLDLTDRLVAGLRRKGYQVLSPVADPAERSGIIVFTAGSPEANEALAKRLYAQGIVMAVRCGRCRVSPHFYNTAADIDRLVEAL